jgi:thymidine phosphorylase
MEQPLGCTVGNAVEVVESIEALKGRGPADLMEVTYALGVHMLLLARIVPKPVDARRRLETAVASGAALNKFRELVTAQGGDPGVIDDYSRLPQAPLVREVPAPAAGYIVDVEPLGIAQSALRLGAGRINAAASVDHAVGITGLMKIGAPVRAGERLCTVHARDASDLPGILKQVAAAFKIGPVQMAPPRLIDELVE